MDSSPTMQVSLCMNIHTIGAHEGMLISTGIFSAGLPNTDMNIDGSSFRQFLPTKIQPIQLENGQVTNGENWTKPTLLDGDMNNNPPQSNRSNVAIENQNPKQLEKPLIRLNVFGDNELVPLRPPPFSPHSHQQSNDEGLLTQFNNGHPPSNSQITAAAAAAATPFISDSTTTTTTLEVYRPRRDSADFFQLPRGPLSHAKESVLIVPSKGPEYERRDKSETQFGVKIRQLEMSPQIPQIDHHQQTFPQMQQQQQKTVQWGDDSIFPYEPSPSASLASSQLTPTISPMSPPQQASTPLQTNDPIVSPTNSTIPIITSPSSEFNLAQPTSLDYLTILRRQHQERCERTQMRFPERGMECPPRPPKPTAAGRRVPQQFGNNANSLPPPPRPPKPEHLRRGRQMRERSQSVDSVNRLGGGGGPQSQYGGQPAFGRDSNAGGGIMRSASSHEIPKLYQTRDCLGRIVCEW